MITVNIDRQLGHSIQITISSSSHLPLYLFVYTMSLEEEEIYHSVATIDSLEKFPPLSPNPGNPFFRKDSVLKEFTSIQSGEDFVELIKAELLQLDVDYQKYLEDNKYGTTETVVINE